jgi:hypothetical protein
MVVCVTWFYACAGHMFDVGESFFFVYGNAKKWSDMNAVFVFVHMCE